MATLRLLAAVFLSVTLVSRTVALPVASSDTEAEAGQQADSGKGVIGGGVEAFGGGVEVGQVFAETALKMAFAFLSGASQFMDKIDG